jgi:hypothetical protein
MEESISYLSPRTPGTGVFSILCESLSHQLPMPVRYFKPGWRSRDPFPKRLDVPNLLIGREVVKSWWRNR